MTNYSEKLARSLEKMNAVQQDGIVRTEWLTRTHHERLIQAGFLQEIVRGWCYVTSPSAASGSTAWFGHYWSFVAQYLADRFGEDYCLNPEASLRLNTGAAVVPRQLIVLCRPSNNQVVNLPLGTSLFIYQEEAHRFPKTSEAFGGIRVMTLANALLRLPESFFQNAPQDAAVALQLVRDVTPLLRELLEEGRTTIAGRLAGAFRHIGDTVAADRILRSMKSAGHDVRENNPFQSPPPAPLLARATSPYVARLHALWASLREDVARAFSDAPVRPTDPAHFLTHLDEQYVQDAYHSLSIEGYRVSPELIEKIRQGEWNPETNTDDRQSRDALAARGYLEAFQAVRHSLESIFTTETYQDIAAILRIDHQDWYQALFAPSVRAGLLPAATLAGYRNGPVYIRGSRHGPLPAHALGDAMEALFDLISAEENAAVRAVLGHFLFVYIHPYADGNGRMARFLMNALFAGGGFPWTIVHLDSRSRYMTALEAASVEGDIKPFVLCIHEEMNRQSY